MTTMIDTRYPERATRTYKFIWENQWITAIEGLHKDQFVVFDLEDETFFHAAARNEQFELVILIRYSDKQVLRIRSLSPFTYTEAFTEIDTSDPAVRAEIDRRIQERIAEAPAHLMRVRAIIEALEWITVPHINNVPVPMFRCGRERQLR